MTNGTRGNHLLTLRNLCEEESLATQAAADRVEAMRLLERDEYAVIVVDLQMDADGLGIIDHLRVARPTLLERGVLFTGFESAPPLPPGIPPVAKANLATLRYAIRRAADRDVVSN